MLSLLQLLNMAIVAESSQKWYKNERISSYLGCRPWFDDPGFKESGPNTGTGSL